MEKKLRYYEQESVKLFGRPIAQVLLIHASRLNADHIGQLISMITKNGYTFADLATVLKDEAYRTPITVYKKYGISWLDRWAISAGKSGDFFKDEPDVPPYIRAGWRSKAAEGAGRGQLAKAVGDGAYLVVSDGGGARGDALARFLHSVDA